MLTYKCLLLKYDRAVLKECMFFRAHCVSFLSIHQQSSRFWWIHINEGVMKPHHRVPSRCVLMLWDWIALNKSAKAQWWVTYDVTQRPFRFVTCFILKVFPPTGDTACDWTLFTMHVHTTGARDSHCYRLNIVTARVRIHGAACHWRMLWRSRGENV